MQNLYNDLKDLLQQDERLVVDGKLLKNKIIELALAMDGSLLKLLLSHAGIKKHFFSDVEGLLVFDKIKFQKFISNKQFLPNSFTAFKNKIGLTANDEFITESKEVVLAWPYKDCVLEGGQTKDDAKRNEIFWNETLAPDEIDLLLSPKVLTNFKKYDKVGEHPVTEITLNDNLIIKGNNLLSLHTLLKVYRGRIRIIYIDPPYNTISAANTFAYNNSFNHSSWLSFMKNRLEVAKQLLTKDGIFIISIDHYELFYLGVLLDEIFGRENRMGVIAVVHNPGGRQDEAFFPTAHENMIFYARNINNAKLNTLGSSDEKLSEYKLSDKDGKYKLRGFRRSGNNSKREQRPGLFYPIYLNTANLSLSLTNKDSYIELLPIDEQGTERCWRWGKDTFIKKMDKYIEVKKTKNGYDIYIKEREGDYEGEKPKTIWDKAKYTGQSGTSELKNLFGDKVFSYPKSLHLIYDILKIATNPNDIVLDFFGGSGTTAHAVLELNKFDAGSRKFILCEQMDYIDTVTKQRVWQVMKNGYNDSFIFCELAKANQVYIDKIQEASTKEQLLAIWTAMQDKAFISYNVNIAAINDKSTGFDDLTLKEQQKFLIEILDKNLLYVPYTSIDDKDYNISEDDKKLNKMFYILT